jgi:hypothetical protein
MGDIIVGVRHSAVPVVVDVDHIIGRCRALAGDGEDDDSNEQGEEGGAQLLSPM